MDETGTMSELERRLRTKAEEDRKRSERIYQAELKTLGANLSRRVRQEADSIVSAMESLTRPVAGTLRRLTLLYIALGVLLSLGTCGANLALMQWQSSQIKSLREERARLETEIADQRLTIERLNDKTWGVDLAPGDNNRKFMFLPRGTSPSRAFLHNGRWLVEILTD